MYGPYISCKQPNGKRVKKQTYLVAIIDDHSRLIAHGEFFLSQDVKAYLKTLKSAILKRGIPEKLYCDNGQVFLSPQIKTGRRGNRHACTSYKSPGCGRKRKNRAVFPYRS